MATGGPSSGAMDGDRLPPIAACSISASGPSSAGGGGSGGGGGGGSVVALPPLSPPPDPYRPDDDISPPPDPYYRVPSPLLPPHGDSVFLTATPEEMLAGMQEEVMPVHVGHGSGRWHAPPAARRVGSYIRSTRYCIHLRGCSKCRTEGLNAHDAAAGRTRGAQVHFGGGGGGGGRRRGAEDGDGGAGKKSASTKCSSLCVHLPSATQGRASKDGAGDDSGGAKQSVRKRLSSRFALQGEEWQGTLVKSAGPTANGPPDVRTLSIYHDRDFSQLTWEELMALLTSNFQKSKDLSKAQIKCLEEMKEEIVEAVEAGLIKSKDTRLKWRNRKMMLVHQVTSLVRARDIYRAVQETLVDHNAHLRRLSVLLEVRAYRQVHGMKFDYLKSGCSLLRFTQVPGRLCRGINLYQACLAVVIGRRWVIRVLERKLHRINQHTDQVNAEIETVFHYKFQELPVDKMRESNLLKRLDDLTQWFEDVKTQMTGTVHSLHAELESRRLQQIRDTIVATMDGEVDGEPDWQHLCDFNRCLAALVADMAARNALLLRLIGETRSSARRRGRDDAEWRSWLLQQQRSRPEGEKGEEGRLNIRRKTWLPV